ncbi:hyalin [Kibdelosporangium philippinense]|uniref:Hyalin n=1 Tax=Kibdelosporangium philippinense TaxID=211113 RepID=A0ABS8ZZ04_9PSEU|nr:Calx-beta domain-containing protein [Kibdelosporangium philippinense]MCE7012003.1 hyalin [Kibdelosporangium philippinense]
MPTRTLALAVVSAALFAGLATPAVPAQVDPPSVDFTVGPGGHVAVKKTVTTPVVPPNPDIVLLGDSTGSMMDVIQNVVNNANAITSQVLKAQPSARFAVAEYKHNVDGAQVFTVNQPLTNDQDQVRAATLKWLNNAGGGGIPTTDFINAHYRIGTDAIGFRPDSSRIIAWFGDAGSENPSLGHSLQQALDALKSKQIRVIAVPISGTDGGGLNSRGQASTITAQTGGVLMPDSSPGAVATAILDGIKELDVTVTHRPTDCAPQLTTTITPASKQVRSGQTAEFNEVIGVKEGTAPGVYRCKVDFLINGQPEGLTQNITIRVPGVQVEGNTVNEGNVAVLNVTLDQPATEPITVHYETVNGTATAGSDYVAAVGDLTFEPRQTFKQLSIQIVEDYYYEYDETFAVRFTQSGRVVGTGTVTIRDDDGDVTVTSCTANAVKLLNKKVATANPAKASCKSDSKSVASANLEAGLVAVEVDGMTAKTGKDNAKAGAGSVKITALDQVIEIGLIESNVSATCGKGKTSGSSKVGSVKINGKAVKVGSGPVTIPLLVGSLKLNSTVKTATSVTQRAVSLDTALADLVIAESQVECPKKK